MTRLERDIATGQPVQREPGGPNEAARRMRRANSGFLFVGYLLSVFAVSLTGTVAVGYFFVQRIQAQAITLNALLQGEFIWPIVAIATAVTIGIAGLSHFIASALRSHSEQLIERRSHDTILHTRAGDSEHVRQVFRIKRSAERLSEVEENLIRRLARTNIDRGTYDLITRMQICTNRLVGQIQEFSGEDDRQLKDADKDRRETNRPDRLDVELDDVTVG